MKYYKSYVNFLKKNCHNENQEGVNISIKKTTLLLSVVFVLFLLIGVASATEIDNVTITDDSNLIVDKLSADNFEDTNLEKSDSNSDSNVLTSDDDEQNDTVTTKVDTVISVSNARYASSHTVFKVTLKDTDGNLLANKTVSLKVNGKTYSGITGDKGISLITTKALERGKYTVTAKFNGDTDYTSHSFSGKVAVYSSMTNRANMVKTYGVTKYFTATFWKDQGKLANTNVKITLNGKTYTVKTDSKGNAKIATNLVPGKYKIKLYNPYSKETVTHTITVNKDSSKITDAKNVYILPKTKYSYSVILKSGQNKVIKNAKITFTYNNKKVTKTTNENGKATVTIPALSKGTYTIKYQYNGNSKFKAVSGSKKMYVKDSTTTLKASNLKMQYNDGSTFSVKATDSAGKALANKNIKFTFNGKTTTAVTDSNGEAKLAIGNLKPGTYTAKYVYSTAGLKDYNTGSKTVTIQQQKVTIAASDLVMKYNDGTNYIVTIKNKTGTPLKGIQVEFTLNGDVKKITTDENGTATLPITQKVGYYPVEIQIIETSYYTSSKVTKHILVNGTKFSASDLTVKVSAAKTFTVKLLDGQSKAVSGKTITFTLNNKKTSVQTDENGIAELDISGLAKGTYTVNYTDGSVSGSSKISVVDTVTLKQIIEASQNVKKYIVNNEALPKSVSIGGVSYTTAQYLYLASQAIINLNNNNKGAISIKEVNNPTSPKDAANLGNLYDYVTVAKSIVDTVNSKGTMPNSVSSKVGTIGYNGLVDAFARVIAFYDDYSIMPNYVTIKTYESSSYSSLNTKNTITNLKAYLAASTNCQVGNSKIKSIVDSLTSGLTTDKAKATAIYNYVRDKISYSFYYDTKYGAVGTLNAKQGNCVDQAHLLIAMYRTAGLAARYAHGTCYFTLSGSTYGHVWTQVLIGDTWIVGDPTSTRNSFGNVVNWNNNNYALKGYYSSIAF